jgi:hypothetical protein
MNWFEENAAAIQALSSVAGLLVAGVLAWLTGRYVRLTRDIAISNLEQVKHIREAARLSQQQNARALESLALRIRVALGQLNPDVPKHKELRAFDLLTERDVADLEALARQVDGRAITSASNAAVSLRVIHGMIKKAKDINEVMGWVPTDHEIQRWKSSMEAGHRSLQEVETSCHHVAAT